MSRRAQRPLGFLLGVVGPIALPLLVETLVAGGGRPPVYVPESFVDASDALDRYLADHGRVPTAAEGLGALVPRYLPAVPLDPWTGEPYPYTPAADGQSADLITFGRDGHPGGEGVDADVSLRALAMGPPAPEPRSSAAALVNLSFLATPLAALIASRRWPWATATLAGSACFTGVLLAAIAFGRAAAGAPLAIALVTAIASATAGVLVLRERRGAAVLAFALLVLAWLQLTLLAS